MAKYYCAVKLNWDGDWVRERNCMDYDTMEQCQDHINDNLAQGGCMRYFEKMRLMSESGFKIAIFNTDGIKIKEIVEGNTVSVG